MAPDRGNDTKYPALTPEKLEASLRTDEAISSRRSWHRVRLVDIPKPSMCCFMNLIVSVLHADPKPGMRRYMQAF